MIPKRVGLAGYGGVGKSEAAKMLQEMFGYERLHVKNFLAESVNPILVRLGVPESELAEYTHGSKINDPLPLKPHLTARKLLQVQGGEFLQATDKDLMTFFWLNETDSTGGCYVAESIRYARESEMYRESGVKVIRITRPGCNGLAGGHMSEADQSFPVDAEIVNDGTLDDLRASLARQVRAWNEHRCTAVIINGPPRSGKDALVELIAQQARLGTSAQNPPVVRNVSSIDCVRSLFTRAGIDVTNKTPGVRRLLANTGDLLEAEFDFKTNYVVDQVNAVADAATSRRIVFIHVREPVMIAKIEHRLKAHGHDVMKVFVIRETGDAIAVSNDDVKEVDVAYDVIIHNNGTLDHLVDVAHILGKIVKEGSVPQRTRVYADMGAYAPDRLLA